MMRTKRNPIQKAGIYFLGMIFLAAFLASPAPSFASGPLTADILPATTFARANQSPGSQYLDFHSPESGQAVLRIVNGAQDGIEDSERISSSLIYLNGKKIVAPQAFSQNVGLIEETVYLNSGSNNMDVELRSKVGGQIVITIQAVADAISIISATTPVSIGGAPLEAKVLVTALGVPVPNAEVVFEVTGLGYIEPQTAVTNADGLAYVQISGFKELGDGLLIASVSSADLSLTEAVPIEVQWNKALALEQGLNSIEINAGSSGYIAFTVEYLGGSVGSDQITLSQVITPYDGGVSLIGGYPLTGWSVTDPITHVVNQRIDGISPGRYTIITTAELASTGERVAKELIVEVVDPENLISFALDAPASDPNAIPANEESKVTFTTKVSGFPKETLFVFLEQVDVNGDVINVLGELHDDGKNEDKKENDRIYTGTFTLPSTAEGVVYFRAVTHSQGDYVHSGIYELKATRFPIGPDAYSENDFVYDPNASTYIVSNEVILGFVDGLLPERIEEIVQAVGGVIVGTIPTLDVYQVRISNDSDIAALYSAIATFDSYPEVRYAEPSARATFLGFPDDPLYEGPPAQKSYLQSIRADEAWIVGRGGKQITIAVVDTGVDYNHPELAGRVIRGKDFILKDDNDPMDTDGHGTFVAGVAGAEGNNGIGVAGVAWHSNILAVRAIAFPSTLLTIAAGIEYAASRADIINVSGGAKLGKFLITDAIRFADKRNALVVSGAANEGVNAEFYPCAIDPVVCVASVGNNHERSAFTNWGSWVDISAPGENIVSTGLNATYIKDSGTSYSAPLVSGAAALVMSSTGIWRPEQIREILEKSARPFTDEKIGQDSILASGMGVGVLDAFDAIFNGSFELGDLSGWSAQGTCSSLPKLGPLKPTDRKRLGYCSTGPGEDNVSASLSKSFVIAECLDTLPLSFDYTFVTEEYPEFVGSQFDDSLQITVTLPNGDVQVVAVESVNASGFEPIEGIDFPGGDDTVGFTGWGRVEVKLPLGSNCSGNGVFKIEIQDAGDDVYDSAVLIDNIQMKVLPGK